MILFTTPQGENAPPEVPFKWNPMAREETGCNNDRAGWDQPERLDCQRRYSGHRNGCKEIRASPKNGVEYDEAPLGGTHDDFRRGLCCPRRSICYQSLHLPDLIH